MHEFICSIPLSTFYRQAFAYKKCHNKGYKKPPVIKADARFIEIYDNQNKSLLSLTDIALVREKYDPFLVKSNFSLNCLTSYIAVEVTVAFVNMWDVSTSSLSGNRALTSYSRKSHLWNKKDKLLFKGFHTHVDGRNCPKSK